MNYNYSYYVIKFHRCSSYIFSCASARVLGFRAHKVSKKHEQQKYSFEVFIIYFYDLILDPVKLLPVARIYQIELSSFWI